MIEMILFFFFNDTATTEIYTLSLHDALPIFLSHRLGESRRRLRIVFVIGAHGVVSVLRRGDGKETAPFARIHYLVRRADRKSTRLNSSHANISYAVFCLKKKKKRT